MKIKLFLVTVLIMGVLLSGCAEEEKYTGEVEKITLAAYEGDTGLLPYIAKEQGFFEENGLDVEIKNYESGKQATDVLLAREADISTSAGAVFVSNSFEHDYLRILGTVATAEVTGLIARKDRGITTATDLVGKKIGVTRKSNAEFSLGIFLTFNELSVADVEIVDLVPSEIVNSLISGDIDAGYSWEPNLYNAKVQLGDNAVIIKEDAPEFNFILLSKKEWVDNNPDAAKRFMKAIVQAEQYVNQNEEVARQFMKERFNYEQVYSDSTWGDHDFTVELPQSLIITLEDQARWAINNGLTDATEVPNYLDYIYFDALEEVKPEAVGIIH
jgi:NitT/TauT family transport system substrate-binding protein